MGDRSGSEKFAGVSPKPLEGWRQTFNNPVRKAWGRRYLRWIGRDRLAIMGYDLDNLLSELDGVPTSRRHVGSDLVRGCWGLIRDATEPKILGQKLSPRSFNQNHVYFWEMEPQGKLSSSGTCMTRTADEYVVYTAAGGAFTVDLSAADGMTLEVRWYDPRTGRFQQSATVVGGNVTHVFTPPYPGDAVLHLRRPRS